MMYRKAICFTQIERGLQKIHWLAVFFMIAITLTACAQVPKESVELSSTVGRDLAVVYDAHRELAQVLFSRMRHDVNRFVDDVYAPYQIKVAMDRQGELAFPWARL